MDFLLLLILNLVILVLMYLSLRYLLTRNYSNEKFLETLQKEVNGIITDLNSSTENSVRILHDESEKLKKLRDDVQAKTNEMQQLFLMLDRADGRYTEILERTRSIKRKAVDAAAYGLEVPPIGNISATPTADHASLHGSSAPQEPIAGQSIADTQADPAMHGADQQAPAAGRILSPREQVLAFYRQGRSVEEIAELTRMARGEIDLIIQMFSGGAG